jgi:large subunit ribosomal protein L24
MVAKIKRDDTVLVIAGKNRGLRGKVRQVHPEENRATIEGVNIVKRHTRAQGIVQQAGIIEKEAPLQLSNLMIICPNCESPTRVGFDRKPDGTKTRICKRCGDAID